MNGPSTAAGRLYALLPQVYRVRDAQRGFVLRELMEVLAGPAEVLEEDAATLYDDQFIETCARWVVPYLGDLIGYRLLPSIAERVGSPRPEVANTVRYRRRKGTAAVLEQLANDVTGWPARAVEFFERLTVTQYMNHVRPQAAASVNLRDVTALSWITQQNAAFDDLAHTADVRRIATGEGRHNIPNVGIFLWRIAAVPLARSPLVPHQLADGRRFRFDALGADAPLFADPRPEADITHLAEPFDVPLPLGRRWLDDHLDAYYGAGRSLELIGVPQGDVRICDLSDVPGGAGSWAHEPPPGTVAIDPVLGRVFFGTALAAGSLTLANYHYGAAVPIGAGGHARGEPLTPSPERTAAAGEALQPHLDALDSGGTLRIIDSNHYVETPTIKAANPDTQVVVRAADRARPVLVASGPVKLAMQPGTTVLLDGLFVTGGPVVLEESADTEVRTVVLRDCTLVPPRPTDPNRASLLVLHPFTRVRLERCIMGSIVAVEGAQVSLRDCVVDAAAPARVAFCGRVEPAGGGLRTVGSPSDADTGDGTTPGSDLDLRECTVVGGAHATRLDASNSLLHAALVAGDPRPAAVWARRRQVGCLRFSYLPEGSRTGRRYRCRSEPPPRFSSLRFGDPAYAQLRPDTPDAIRRGADDESEMGVTHLLFTPQREESLLLRLDEYLRFGLEAGVFYAT